MLFEIGSWVDLVVYLVVKDNIHDIMFHELVQQNEVPSKQLKVLFRHLFNFDEVH